MRLEGWEGRLAAVIEAARGEPYELGRHDCFRLACRSAQALTGVDLWSEWAGTYRTRSQALRRITEYAGTYDRAFSRLFGCEPVDVRQARQGDVLKFVENGEPHLGVCVGAEAAVLGEKGLLFVPLLDCERCWRIG